VSAGQFTTTGVAAIAITRWPSTESVTPATTHIWPSRTSVSPRAGTRSVITYSQAPEGKRMVMDSAEDTITDSRLCAFRNVVLPVTGLVSGGSLQVQWHYLHSSSFRSDAFEPRPPRPGERRERRYERSRDRSVWLHDGVRPERQDSESRRCPEAKRRQLGRRRDQRGRRWQEYGRPSTGIEARRLLVWRVCFSRGRVAPVGGCEPASNVPDVQRPYQTRDVLNSFAALYYMCGARAVRCGGRSHQLASI